MQKKTIYTLFTALLLSVQGLMAQLQLPQPSPKATVMQTIGLTEITIDYSCPGVKGRTIWGDLVPYDQIWRAGANSATKITFSKDVTIENTEVPKGTYSIFMIPSQSGWTVIINKDASASTDQYKQEKDVVRIKAFPSTMPKRERLAYSFSNFTEDQTSVDMEWENVRVSFTVKAATSTQAEENIKSTTGNTWRLHANAARYYLEKKNLPSATQQIDKSLMLDGAQWYSLWIKAQIMAELKDYKAAYDYAAKAKKLGDEKPADFFWKDLVEKALVDWKPLAEQGAGKKKK